MESKGKERNSPNFGAQKSQQKSQMKIPNGIPQKMIFFFTFFDKTHSQMRARLVSLSLLLFSFFPFLIAGTRGEGSSVLLYTGERYTRIYIPYSTVQHHTHTGGGPRQPPQQEQKKYRKKREGLVR